MDAVEDKTVDYRTRDERLSDTFAELRDVIRQLEMRVIVLERKVEYDREQ